MDEQINEHTHNPHQSGGKGERGEKISLIIETPQKKTLLFL